MKQKEKDLLIKDLCSRLPYGVIVHEKWEYQNPGVKERTKKEEDHIMNCYDLASIRTIKPYLRPMSSMTEEERKELSIILNYEFYVDDDFALVAEDDRHRIRLELCDGYIDWLNAHHFDYRIDLSTGKTLIESGLALEAPEDMYK